jgi:hypothetical protein
MTAAIFTAEPGERNDLDIEPGRSDEVTVLRDRGAPLRAAAPCSTVDTFTVQCPGSLRIRFDTGDGDDRVRAGRPAEGTLGAGDDAFIGMGSVNGGGGRDELRSLPGVPAALDGGAGDDLVIGDEGADWLAGGPGSDILIGGGGDDRLSGVDGEGGSEVPAGDRIEGGPGRDLLDYSGRNRDFALDLAVSAAQGAERETVIGVEDLVGGSGDDRLRGDAGPNDIDGYTGRDIVDGRGGDDRLTGGTGIDEDDAVLGGAGADHIDGIGSRRLDGGSGDDVVDQPSIDADVTCGPGNDVLAVTSGLASRVPMGCEQLRFGTPSPLAVTRFPALEPLARIVRLSVPCPRQPPFRLCLAELRVSGRRHVILARSARSVPGGGQRTLRVRIGAGARKFQIAIARRRLDDPHRIDFTGELDEVATFVLPSR